jgi:hypothetical protein
MPESQLVGGIPAAIIKKCYFFFKLRLPAYCFRRLVI